MDQKFLFTVRLTHSYKWLNLLSKREKDWECGLRCGLPPSGYHSTRTQSTVGWWRGKRGVNSPMWPNATSIKKSELSSHMRNLIFPIHPSCPLFYTILRYWFPWTIISGHYISKDLCSSKMLFFPLFLCLRPLCPLAKISAVASYPASPYSLSLLMQTIQT